MVMEVADFHKIIHWIRKYYISEWRNRVQNSSRCTSVIAENHVKQFGIQDINLFALASLAFTVI